MLAAWLPVFAGSALASVVCKSQSSFSHALGDRAHMDGHDATLVGGHPEVAGHGAAAACDDCDLCYSHCMLWLPATARHLVPPAPRTTMQGEPARLSSLTFAPADRPPLARLG